MVLKIKGKTYYDIEEIHRIVDMSRDIISQSVRHNKGIRKSNVSHLDNNNNTHSQSILTQREIEVLTLVSHGLFNKEISFELGITKQTVKNHVSSILLKLNASGRTEAATKAIKSGLL